MHANLTVVSPRHAELGAGGPHGVCSIWSSPSSPISSSRDTVNKVNLGDGFNVMTFFSCFSNFQQGYQIFKHFPLKETAINITSFFSLSNQVE